MCACVCRERDRAGFRRRLIEGLLNAKDAEGECDARLHSQLSLMCESMVQREHSC